MKVENIPSLIQRLEKEDYSSIIIDGPWGVGKTFQVNKFIEKENNKMIDFSNTDPNLEKTQFRYFLISLFGIKTIGELDKIVHDELGINGKVFDYVNDIAEIIEPSSSVLGSIAKKGCKYGKIKEEEKFVGLKTIDEVNNVSLQTILIFDDFERIDSSLKMINIFGYFNKLLSKKFKIAIVCNSDKIDNKIEFLSFKEKLFDRQYIISKASNSIIKFLLSNFGINENYVNDDIVNNFDNNLRLVKTTGSIFKEIRAHLNSINCYRTINDETLLWYVSLVVRCLNKIDDYSCLQSKNKDSMPLTRGEIEPYFNDDKIIDQIEYACHLESSHSVNEDDFENVYVRRYATSLIIGIAYYYYYEDFERIDFFINDDMRKPKSVFEEKPLFYFDKEGRKDRIKKLLETIMNEDSPLVKEREIDNLCLAYNYFDLFPSDFNEDNLKDKLSKRYSISNRFYLGKKEMLIGSDPFKKLMEKVIIEGEKIAIGNFCMKIKKNIISDDLYVVQKMIANIRSNCFDSRTGTNGIKTMIKEYFDCFKENDFFIKGLKGEIDTDDYLRCEMIVSIFIHTTQMDSLKQFLNKKIIDSDSEEEKERLKALLNECDRQR